MCKNCDCGNGPQGYIPEVEGTKGIPMEKNEKELPQP